MTYKVSRRALGRMFGAGSLSALASPLVSAQFAQTPRPSSLCPPGTRLDRIEVSREIVKYDLELNISRLGAGGKIGVPGTKVTWKLVCTGINEQPLPPPPRQGWIWEDLAVTSGQLDGSDFLTLRPESYFVGLAIPGFAAPVLTDALAELRALRADGTLAYATFPLTAHAGGLVFATPSAVSQWSQVEALHAVSGSFALRNIGIMAYSRGSATYGVVHYLAGRPMAGFSGTLSAALATGVPPRMRTT